MKPVPPALVFSKEVARARQGGEPIVALESTVITHGLPHPENLALAKDMEAEVKKEGAIPATIAILKGKVHVGLSGEQLAQLAEGESFRKVSVRDFAPAIAKGEGGGTTVAGTLLVAEKAGIRVMATGGIGGVHRGGSSDVSTDLTQLARSPSIAVCAGAKAILDLPATLERLETLGVPVIGYQTEEFPAFYSRESELPVTARAESPAEVVEMAEAHWSMGLRSALLVVVPPPEEVALPAKEIEGAIEKAVAEAEERGIRGQALTPFLLARVSELSGKKSLRANLGLLKNNARMAAQIAVQLPTSKKQGIA